MWNCFDAKQFEGRPGARTSSARATSRRSPSWIGKADFGTAVLDSGNTGTKAVQNHRRAKGGRALACGLHSSNSSSSGSSGRRRAGTNARAGHARRANPWIWQLPCPTPSHRALRGSARSRTDRPCQTAAAADAHDTGHQVGEVCDGARSSSKNSGLRRLCIHVSKTHAQSSTPISSLGENAPLRHSAQVLRNGARRLQRLGGSQQRRLRWLPRAARRACPNVNYPEIESLTHEPSESSSVSRSHESRRRQPRRCA